MIEIFCGTARVTACLKQFSLVDSFGTDHVKHRQAMAPVVLADLTTDAGVSLLRQWLANELVVGIFLAPPSGSASRARQIPLSGKRKRPGSSRAEPRLLRSDRYPNGVPSLCFSDRVQISRANKLYDLSAKLIRWACDEGVLFCLENPQFSFFGLQLSFKMWCLSWILQFSIHVNMVAPA